MLHYVNTVRSFFDVVLDITFKIAGQSNLGLCPKLANRYNSTIRFVQKSLIGWVPIYFATQKYINSYSESTSIGHYYCQLLSLSNAVAKINVCLEKKQLLAFSKCLHLKLLLKAPDFKTARCDYFVVLI